MLNLQLPEDLEEKEKAAVLKVLIEL